MPHRLSPVRSPAATAMTDAPAPLDGGLDTLVVLTLVALAVLLLLLGVAGVLATRRSRVRARASEPLGNSTGQTDHADLAPRAAVVVNPTKIDDIVTLRTRVTGWMTDKGWDAPLWLETSTEDTGRLVTLRAVEEGVDLVLACGGDGTVMAVVSGLAGSGVPLGVLPAGTGNLLARNLDLPEDLETAVLTALSGDDRAVDLGQVSAPDVPEGFHFAVMAGMGFDAALVEDAPAALKRAVGWPAYVVSGARHLFDRSMRVSVRLDGGEAMRRRASSVLVGNVGRLQAGLMLLPEARPDDGVLDVIVLAPRGPAGWVRVAGRVLLQQRYGHGRHRRTVEHFTACEVEIVSERPEPRQLDGDPIGAGTSLCLRMRRHALIVRVPASR